MIHLYFDIHICLSLIFNRYVNYVIRRAFQLYSWGIKPLLVFDGFSLEAKRVTEDKRKQLLYFVARFQF